MPAGSGTNKAVAEAAEGLAFKTVETWTLELQVAEQEAEDGSTHEHYRVVVGDDVYPAPTAAEAIDTAARSLGK